MQKKNTIIIAAILLVVAAIATYLLTRSDTETATTKSDSLLTPNYFAEAIKTPSTGACLDENTALTIDADARTDAEYASITHLIDVPAGTNVDVMFATYSETEASGSNRYPETYGSYNFAMTKQGDDWTITKYQRCN